MARLVIAAKYVLAHKGILLEREKLHLSSMGFSAEELVEVTFAVGQMAGLNLLYVAPRPRSFFAIDASLTQVRPPHQRRRRDRDLPQGRGPLQGHGLRGRAQEGRALSTTIPFSVCCCYHRHLPPPSSKHDHNTARATVTRGVNWGGVTRCPSSKQSKVHNPIRSYPAGYYGSRSASSAATASPWTT